MRGSLGSGRGRLERRCSNNGRVRQLQFRGSDLQRTNPTYVLLAPSTTDSVSLFPDAQDKGGDRGGRDGELGQ